MRDLVIAQKRLDKYETKTTLLMVLLALIYIALYAIEVLSNALAPSVMSAVTVVGNIIWVTFAIDLGIRIYISPKRINYIVKHPIDVIAVVLPAFRALRVLRVFTAGQWLMTDGKRLSYGRTGLSLGLAVLFIVGLGGLAVLDAEKNAPGASIVSIGDGIWFAFSTITTVGYGDFYPITLQGKFVAVGLMVLGVSLIGVVSATLSNTFLSAVREEVEKESDVLLMEIRLLRAEVAELRKGRN